MSTFADDLLDLLSPLGNVSAKRMFGGHGIYKDGLMFGFIARGRFISAQTMKQSIISSKKDVSCFTLVRAGVIPFLPNITSHLNLLF